MTEHAPRYDDYEYRMAVNRTLLKWTDQKFDVSPFLKAPADPFHATAHGAIFAADCMKVLPLLKDEVVDTVLQTHHSISARNTARTLTTVYPTNVTSDGAKNGLLSVSAC